MFRVTVTLMDLNLFKTKLEQFVNKDCTIIFSSGAQVDIHPTTFYSDVMYGTMYGWLGDLSLHGFVSRNRLIYLSSFLEDVSVQKIISTNLSFQFKQSYLKLDSSNGKNWEIITIPKGTIFYRIAFPELLFDKDIIFTAEKIEGEYKSNVQLGTGSSLEDKKFFKLKTLEDVRIVQAKVWRCQMFNCEVKWGDTWSQYEKALMQACVEIGASGWKAKVQHDNDYCAYEHAVYEVAFKKGVQFEIIGVLDNVNLRF